MDPIQAVRGFPDVLPADSWKWQVIEQIARETASLYRYDEIRTPVVESTRLYHRGVGEGSDIIRKETFTFNDRGNDSLTLRPEGTAGVVRAAIEHAMLSQEGARAKVFYICSNFRYEMPQKGRYRQHHQFGAEAFGIADPAQDVECIKLQLDFYRRCGLKELSLQINSLGDAESKQRYRDALVAYLSPRKDQLTEESKRRLEENPLRILDSKAQCDKDAIAGAPPAEESLSEKSRAHFNTVKKLLSMQDDLLSTTYTINPNLVRGFDYYTETLWEVTAAGLGSQNAVGGGGRYDNLVESLGGRPTPGVGFGSGLERLLIALEAQGVQLPDNRKPLVWLAYHGPAARLAQWGRLQQLRNADIRADMEIVEKGIKPQFKMANRENARWCVIVGDSEIASQTVALKDMQTGEQTVIPSTVLVEKLMAAGASVSVAK